MREPVTMYKMDQVTNMVRDGYHFQPHGRLAWLQRLLWRVLVKMRAVGPHFTETVQIVRLPCDADGVLAKIMEARHGLFAAHRKPSEVLIGPETLAELLGTPELRDWNSPLTINSQAMFGGERRMFDLPVHIVPQMEGVIVR